MLASRLLSVLLATTAKARPATNDPIIERDLSKRDDIELFEHGIVDVVLFGRDDVLTPQDMELAKTHGVDIQQMWKHSVMKRADGDDYTMWVHNSYTEVDNSTDVAEIEKRQQNARIVKTPHYRGEEGLHCYGRQYNDETGPHAPFTGGIQHMVKWAEGLGYFAVSRVKSDWVPLLIAGSNSGANALFQMKLPADTGFQFLMNFDVREAAWQTNNRYARNFPNGGGYRARGWGAMWCTGQPGDVGKDNKASYWSITNTDSRA